MVYNLIDTSLLNRMYTPHLPSTQADVICTGGCFDEAAAFATTCSTACILKTFY